jgi:hypothetical protein
LAVSDILPGCAVCRTDVLRRTRLRGHARDRREYVSRATEVSSAAAPRLEGGSRRHGGSCAVCSWRVRRRVGSLGQWRIRIQEMSWVRQSLIFVVGGLLFACSGTSAPVGDNTPYTSDPSKTVVLVGGASASGTTEQSGSGCVTLASRASVEAMACGASERRDVVVDSTGAVVAVVCYPGDWAPPVVDATGGRDVRQNRTRRSSVITSAGRSR